ncbi:MAG: methionine gamma-lyase family protein [Firmicutes bacterium]|nr:methionine gamma-lyase family protein [Bacillota bacterium]
MNRVIETVLSKNAADFKSIDGISLINQKKVLDAFLKNRIALRHFNGTSGYGYDDAGRDALNGVIADIFNADRAIASPSIASGTHALSIALFGALRPGDTVLSITGEPYDTLNDAIHKTGVGSLADFGIKFDSIPLLDTGDFDFEAIKEYLTHNRVKMAYIQRSRGYAWRLALSIAQIEKICLFIKQLNPDCVIMCDNCYGEFVETTEPTDVGVDICAGSFIKNIGGGIAPTGGYIVGRADLIDLISGRFTSPSIGTEVGSYASGYRLFYQGLFLAPHTVAQAMKTGLLFASALHELGYDVLPKPTDRRGDIICSIKLESADKMISFCKAIQEVSPVDGFVSPEPSSQPGYADEVIMAAGCFVQGASIELSCDGPIREPYIVYLQGSLTFEHGIIALEQVLNALKFE